MVKKKKLVPGKWQAIKIRKVRAKKDDNGRQRPPRIQTVSETTIQKFIFLLIRNIKHEHPKKTDLERYREIMYALHGKASDHARTSGAGDKVYDEGDYFQMGRAVLADIPAHKIALQIANEKMGANFKEGGYQDTERDMIKTSLLKTFRANKSFYTNLGFIHRYYPFTEKEKKQMPPALGYEMQEGKKLLEADDAQKAIKMKKLVQFLQNEMGWKIKYYQ